jgi:hypothetical protein
MTRDGSEICCVFDMDQEATLIEKLRREGTSALTPEEEAVLYTPRGLARVFPNRLVHLIPVPPSLSLSLCPHAARDGGLTTAAAATRTTGLELGHGVHQGALLLFARPLLHLLPLLQRVPPPR